MVQKERRGGEVRGMFFVGEWEESLKSVQKSHCNDFQGINESAIFNSGFTTLYEYRVLALTILLLSFSGICPDMSTPI